MKLLIKRFDKTLPLPEYKTAGAAAFDLSAREKTIIPSHQTAFVPLNVAIKLPKGYHSLLIPRSSMPKFGIIQANSVGLIDNDYCGDEDEFKLFVYNYTESEVVIEKETRIAQVLIQKTEIAEIEEVENLSSPNRGGFGSTGNK
ncbi:MAG TPA: dUTP diphosphatase [Candidatus Woesebacteria bacterium]|nr:dUTP diphosphatase [Candidatus Woesebacteria bacterium]